MKLAFIMLLLIFSMLTTKNVKATPELFEQNLPPNIKLVRGDFFGELVIDLNKTGKLRKWNSNTLGIMVRNYREEKIFRDLIRQGKKISPVGEQNAVFIDGYPQVINMVDSLKNHRLSSSKQFGAWALLTAWEACDKTYLMGEKYIFTGLPGSAKLQVCTAGASIKKIEFYFVGPKRELDKIISGDDRCCSYPHNPGYTVTNAWGSIDFDDPVPYLALYARVVLNNGDVILTSPIFFFNVLTRGGSEE